MKTYFVYILSNKHRTVFYIGVTNDIQRRVAEHKDFQGSSFCKRYNVTDLMYYESTNDIHAAISREKQLKNWHREWKVNLIKQDNPEMKDLSRVLIQ